MLRPIHWPGRQIVLGELARETHMVHRSSCSETLNGILSCSNLYNWGHADNICLLERLGCHVVASDMNDSCNSSLSFSL